MEFSRDNKYVFISYSHKDTPKVLEYIEQLKQDQFLLWYDENIHSSEWGASIENAIENASAVLLFVTPNSLASTNVRNEMNFADNAGKNVFCIYLSDTDLSDYPGARLMLTKFQAFFAYRDGYEVTYRRLEKCLTEVVGNQSSEPIVKEVLFDIPKESEAKKQKIGKAKILCIKRKFDEAKEIYDEFIADDIWDMDGYMGHIRVCSENYKKFEGVEIDEAIQIAKEISGQEDLTRFDFDYKIYSEKRQEYFKIKETEKKRLESEKYNVGNIVTYGKYWQTHNRQDGKTPIEWIVLRRDPDKAFLLSRYCLDCKQYDTDYNDVTWESSNIRKWLNLKFLNDAFSIEEQERILTIRVSNEENAEYETPGGNDTSDKIFLLSIDEAQNLLNKEERQAQCTEYAKAQGAWSDQVTAAPYWWLRSPGGDALLAAAVHYRGKVFIGGLNICVSDTAVRPALWINIDLN